MSYPTVGMAMGGSSQRTSQGRAWGLAILVFLVVCALWTGALFAHYHGTGGPAYRSEAKLLLRHTAPQPGTNVPPIDPAAVLATEKEILTSYDLARRVLQTLGPGTVLPGASETAEIEGLLTRLDVQESGSGTNIVRLAFHHEDPTSAPKILDAYLAQYFQLHTEIHQPEGSSPQSTNLPSMSIIQRPSVAQETSVGPTWFTVAWLAFGLFLALLLAALTWWLAHRRPPPPAPPAGQLAAG